jgi:gluconate 2-dehydrogenase gamma chain
MARQRVSRRGVLGAGAGLSAAALASGSVAEQLHQRLPWAPSVTDRPEAADSRPGYLFFSPDEAAFMEAALARLIPADERGPGAAEAGVARFIDRQLAGPYGHGDHFYLKGPRPMGEPTQGWQMASPAEAYRAAIVAVNRYAADAKGKPFARLSQADQEAVLTALEKGEADLKGGPPAKAFFKLLLQNAIEGFFSDPLYGGNSEMAGWKLIGFPGARYDYRDFVGKHGQPYPLPPVGLMGRPGWSRR